MAGEQSSEFYKAAYASVPEHPEWKHLDLHPYTKIDDVVYSVRMDRKGNQAIFTVVKFNGPRDIVFSEVVDITDENVANINKHWKMIQDMLPSLIMENLL